ncbi:ALP1-like protein isoform X1 [Tanacetum coccineum]
MAQNLFNEIVTTVIDHDAFFRNNIDCTGIEGISGLLKGTSSTRQLAYGVHAVFQISERTSRMDLDQFCQAVMQIYGPEFLRKPTETDIEKLYRHHEEKHGFPRMLGSIDCMDCEWSNNDINVLQQSLLFNDLKEGKAQWGYYLIEGEYPELVTLVKTIPKPSDDDYK